MGQDTTNKPKIVGDDDSEITILPTERPDQKPPEQTISATIPEEVAVLPIGGLVLFPGTVVPLPIRGEKSRRLIDNVLPDQKIIAIVSQKDRDKQDPKAEDLHDFGTATMVLKLLQAEDGTQSIIVHGLTRVRIKKWIASEPYFRAQITVAEEKLSPGDEIEALVVNARNLARRIIELSPNIPDEATVVLNSIDQPGAMADFLATNLQIDLAVKQDILEELDIEQRLRKISQELQHQLEILQLSQKIQDQVKARITKSQREFFLTEQLKAIQAELGQVDERTAEVQELHKKIDEAGMSKQVEAEAIRELSRLEKIPGASPEYNIIRTYLDWMTEVPWSKSTRDKLDINRAKRILNRDHYGLEKVKRRILEYLAVRKLAPESRGPILCFVGPPGVGKTSLGQSIARAMGRNFIRMSLGGLRDEAELRGHRRTYIGAMPGRIIQEIRKAGTNNPVFMLDEIDKVGADFRGDPTSALLEILDSAQNNTFQDHYLNVPFDLSKVLFIATGNYMAPVPAALRDRMEVIEISGYTRVEKLHIARKYLVKRQLADNGLSPRQAKWTEAAINRIISDYTREAGVRELERQISTVCRGVAALIAQGKARARTVTARLVTEMLGPRKYESELALRTSTPGVATGLAYTPTGGEIIFIEATAYEGKGTLTLTGQIGDIMKESVQAAFSLVKSRLKDMPVTAKELAKTDIHVHVPAASVPKDGPSAGTAMFTALTSLLMKRAVRADVAITGEITLRGLVLPVGGIKEKILAAKRAGIKTVILPERNRKDLVDVPPDVRKELKLAFVRNVDDALEAAIVKPRREGRSKRSK